MHYITIIHAIFAAGTAYVCATPFNGRSLPGPDCRALHSPCDQNHTCCLNTDVPGMYVSLVVVSIHFLYCSPDPNSKSIFYPAICSAPTNTCEIASESAGAPVSNDPSGMFNLFFSSSSIYLYPHKNLMSFITVFNISKISL